MPESKPIFWIGKGKAVNGEIGLFSFSFSFEKDGIGHLMKSVSTFTHDMPLLPVLSASPSWTRSFPFFGTFPSVCHGDWWFSSSTHSSSWGCCGCWDRTGVVGGAGGGGGEWSGDDSQIKIGCKMRIRIYIHFFIPILHTFAFTSRRWKILGIHYKRDPYTCQHKFVDHNCPWKYMEILHLSLG